MQNFFLCKNPKKRKRRTNFVKKKKMGGISVMAKVHNGLCITTVPGGPGTQFSHPDPPDDEMLLSGVCTLCRVE